MGLTRPKKSRNLALHLCKLNLAKEVWITFKKSCPIPPPICIGPSELERVTEFKLLGVYIQSDLNWNTHDSSIVKYYKRVKGIFSPANSLSWREFLTTDFIHTYKKGNALN